jgi:anti-sigma factor RsiW
VTGEAHRDVASYALGVLDERDTARFEEHLAACPSCAAELESFLPVVAALSDVDGSDLAWVERSDAEGGLLDRVLAAVGEDRRRARNRRLYTLAAGVVLLAMLTGLGFAVGTRMGDPGPTTRPPGVSAASPDPWGGGQPGPGGSPAPEGERFRVDDAASGIHAEFLVEARPFGTRISAVLGNLTGPRVCRLVIVPESGPAEAVSSWSVPPAGYGTPAQPQPLTLQAATAVPRDSIRQVQVQQIGDDGAATPLLTVSI